MKTNVIMSLRVEGIHRWSGCNIDDVDFLKEPHRHVFHITAKKIVEHDDRDVEIIMFKRKMEQYLFERHGSTNKNGDRNVCYFGELSCEMIAKELVTTFKLEYCSVLEDGENGAEVWR